MLGLNSWNDGVGDSASALSRRAVSACVKREGPGRAPTFACPRPRNLLRGRGATLAGEGKQLESAREREGLCHKIRETEKLGVRGLLGAAFVGGVPGEVKGLGQEVTFSVPFWPLTAALLCSHTQRGWTMRVFLTVPGMTVSAPGPLPMLSLLLRILFCFRHG